MFSMRTFVALMRGINVGSARKLPMADLRDAVCAARARSIRKPTSKAATSLVDAKGGAAGFAPAVGEGIG